MDFIQEVNTLFSPEIAQYGIEISGTDGVRILSNAHVDIRLSQSRMEVTMALMLSGSEIGVPIQTLVKEQGGNPAEFLPDGNAPIEDLDGDQIETLKGLREMLLAYYKDALDGKSEQFKTRMAEAEYEYKVKDYVFKNAPMSHPARRALRAPFWKEEAEKFLKEQGVEF